MQSTEGWLGLGLVTLGGLPTLISNLGLGHRLPVDQIKPPDQTSRKSTGGPNLCSSP